MRPLRFSPKAVLDIEAIWDYTADHWGVGQAERYVGAIRDVCLALARGEMAGRDAAHIRAGYRTAPSGRHVIFVRSSADGTLEVVRVLHGRMNIPGQFDQDDP